MVCVCDSATVTRLDPWRLFTSYISCFFEGILLLDFLTSTSLLDFVAKSVGATGTKSLS